MRTSSSATLKSDFLAPLFQSLATASHTRVCSAISDSDWLVSGVYRCLESVASGRDILQKLGLWKSSRSTYFESLKSNRRLGLVEEVNRLSRMFLCKRQDDLISRHMPDLDGYEVYAGDGHWHTHASRDQPRNFSGKKYATGHLYGLNLRTGYLSHLITNDESKKKEHDLSAIKRLGVDAMRMDAPKGTKVVWIWDRAGIDFRLWHKFKNTRGIYFVSREKENMKLTVVGENIFDKNAAINQGVQSDNRVGTFAGTEIRRIVYLDPASGDTFRFITSITDTSVSPGAIVALYRMRWDIEKAFDDVKNKFREQKAWASSETAKSIQAELICLTWNLVRAFEASLQKHHGLTNESETQRRKKRLKDTERDLQSSGHCLDWHTRTLRRVTQVSVKFIRWIRYRVWNEHSDEGALEELRSLYARL